MSSNFSPISPLLRRVARVSWRSRPGTSSQSAITLCHSSQHEPISCFYSGAMPWGLERWHGGHDLHFISFSCYRDYPGLERRATRGHPPVTAGLRSQPRSGGMKLGGGVSPRSCWEINASRRAATLPQHVLRRMLHPGFVQQCGVLGFEGPLAVMPFLLLDIPSNNVHS